MADVYAMDGKAECCSEGGGRHWMVGAAAGTFDAVNSGDVAKFGNIAGVALVDYNTDTDTMTVDIDGCHEIAVTAKDQDGGNLAVVVGSFIIWDASADLFKPFDGTFHAANDVGFGIAMAAITGGASKTICVKLYPFPLFTGA